MSGYRSNEIDRLPEPEDDFYRLQISSNGGGSTKHLNITKHELAAIRAVLEASDGAWATRLVAEL